MKKCFIELAFIFILLFGWIAFPIPSTKLHGFTEKIIEPQYTTTKIMNGEFQIELENKINSSFPLRNYYIKAHNQIVFSCFRESPNDSIILGKNNYLFEEAYIQEYIDPESWYDKSEIDKKIYKLKWIQDELKRKEKNLVVLITPSKAHYYSQYIPDRYTFFNKKGESALSYLLAKLDNYNINYYNSNLDMEKLSKNDVQLFSKMGTHWTNATACLVGENFLEYLRQSLNLEILDAYTDEIRVVKEPIDPDNDLFLLLNTYNNLSKVLHYKDEVFYEQIVKSDLRPGVRPLNIVVQGGSFQYEINNFMLKNKRISITGIQNKDIYKNGSYVFSFEDIKQLNYNSIIENDLFIFEVNVEAVERMGFGFIDELYDFLNNTSEVTALPMATSFNEEDDLIPGNTLGLYPTSKLPEWTGDSFCTEIYDERIYSEGLSIEFYTEASNMVKINKVDNATIDIYINGKLILKSIPLVDGENRIKIDSSMLKLFLSEPLFIEGFLSHTFSPKKLGISEDDRELGILLRYIGRDRT